MKESGRVMAGTVGAMAVLALVLQFAVAMTTPGLESPGTALWRMLAYFTVLTNLAVAAALIYVALGGDLSVTLHGAMTVSIVAVGLVYHLVLRDLWQPQGLAWWADHGLHSAVPVYTALFWLFFAPKSTLSLREPFLWLAVPLGYWVYAMGRGIASGFYPYPFLDPALHRLPALLMNALAVFVLFLALGFCLLGIARMIRRNTQKMRIFR